MVLSRKISIGEIFLGVPSFVVIDTSGHLAFKERGWWSSDREAVNLLARELERAGARA